MVDSTRSAAGSTAEAPRASKRRAWFISPATIALGLAALLLAWQWYDSHNRMNALRAELAQRVRESEA
ncbi:MAG TPA: hypothetical protein VI363_10160, partial [Burkholderiales bacterium]